MDCVDYEPTQFLLGFEKKFSKIDVSVMFVRMIEDYAFKITSIWFDTMYEVTASRNSMCHLQHSCIDSPVYIHFICYLYNASWYIF